jgi:glycosyltransferase involved in cell wall biosynthesis
LTARHTNSISAIVCNYNYGDFIHEALDSLARQTHRPNKLIIVDDGSDDFSRNVIDEFLAARGDLFDHCHFIRNEANVGKLACLNTALALVDTTYSIILDSDDFLPEHAIESLLANLLNARQTAPETSFVYSDSYLVNQEGDVICRGRSAEWSVELLSTHSYIPECALTLSAPLKEAAPFDESIRVGTKHHKWMRIARSGWIGRYVAEPLFFYRMHDTNMSGIGRCVLAEDDQSGRKDRLLLGYWRVAKSDEVVPG